MKTGLSLIMILLFWTACTRENEFRAPSDTKTTGHGEASPSSSFATQSSGGRPWIIDRDSQGRQFVRVTDQAALDKILQSVWVASRTALRAGDTAKAASYYTQRERAEIKRSFDHLLIPYSQVDIPAITWLQQYGHRIVYNAQYGGEVVFALDDDEQWRIEFY